METFKSLKNTLNGFFKKNPYLQIIGWNALVVALLFAGSWLIAHFLMGGKDFYVKWSSTVLLRTEQINPYSNQATQRIAESAESTIFFPLAENAVFSSPIYSLFLYYPLSFIRNFEWARAVWLTCCTFFWVKAWKGQNLFKRISNTSSQILFLWIFAFLNVFTLMIFLWGDLVAISFLLILFAFQKIQEGKYELAGIFCGLATLNPGLALSAMLIFTIFSIKNRNAGFLVWFLITTGLLCFSGYLLQNDWMIQFLQSNIKVVRTLISSVDLGIKNLTQLLKIALPLILALFEWLRSLNRLDQPEKVNWIFNYTILLLALGFCNLIPSLIILFLPAIFQIYSEWEKRESSTARLIGYGHLGVYLVISILLLILKPGILVGKDAIPEFLVWPTGFHLIVGMYWIRGWLYQDTMRNFIKSE